MHALSLSFEGQDIEKIIDENGEEWMTLEDSGRCVGYATPRQSAAKLIGRYASDFKGLTTEVILASVNGSRRKHLLLSREGLMTLALLAKTDQAARFRAWIREFFMSPQGGYQQLLQMVQGQQATILELQQFNTRALGLAHEMASANGRALAAYRWRLPPDPSQLNLPFSKVRHIAVDEVDHAAS